MAGRGTKGIRASFKDARRKLELVARADPLPEKERDGYKAGLWPGAPCDNLPPDCPVIPLGQEGKVTWFLDSAGQLVSYAQNEHSKKMLLQLFALFPNYLKWAWPRWSAPKPEKPPRINGVETDNAIACLLKPAAKRIFKPDEMIRGRGGWRDKHNRFLWFSGDYLWTNAGDHLGKMEPGALDEHVYPRRPAIMHPYEEPVELADSPAPDLLKIFQSWNWERPALDPVLLLGAIMVGFFGGALNWRPAIFATGDFSVGKSTMHEIIKAIYLDVAISTAETTAAGIYQSVGHDCVPILIDELEAEADNRKVMQVIELARSATGGTTIMRGSASHTSVQFAVHNTFFFSAINPPPLMPQDKSRMAILNLQPLVARAGERPVINDVQGRMLLRQAIDGWPEYLRLLDQWYELLRGAGLKGRAQQTFGALLAGAELVGGPEFLSDAGLPSDEAALADMIRKLTFSDRVEQTANWRMCLEQLFSSLIEGSWHGGVRPTVGATLEKFRADLARIQVRQGLDDFDIVKDAQERLAGAGLGLKPAGVLRRNGADTEAIRTGPALAVPASGAQLNRIFAGTVWGNGVWMGALKQAPHDIVVRPGGNENVMKINGAALRCVFVDLDAYWKHGEEEPK